MLATDSAETRFDFSARKDLYTAYVPFAVAAGSGRAVGEEVRDVDGNGCAATGLVQLIVDSSSGWGFAGGSGRREFRQFRFGAVVVDRRLHRIAVVVVVQRQQRRWRWSAAAVAAVAAEEEADHGEIRC